MNEKKKKVNHQWQRVQRTELPWQVASREVMNRARLKNKEFRDKCEKLGLPITKRQASKFNNSKGLVFKSMRRKNELRQD